MKKRFYNVIILACIMTLLIPTVFSNATQDKQFTLKPLPYPYEALEPYIDKETMMLHHDKHEQAYVDNLNKAIAKHPELFNKSIEELLANLNSIPEDIREDVRNNAGGVYNHDFFWSIMGPEQGGKPIGNLAKAIDRDFGSFEKFKEEFDKAGLSRFGSGWAWLLSDNNGKLVVASTPNQDGPIPLKLKPIIASDVWEHAYYLKYQNRRGEYLDNWWNVVNWEEAEKNYNQK